MFGRRVAQSVESQSLSHSSIIETVIDLHESRVGLTSPTSGPSRPAWTP
jgi:hypothetical protein